MIKHGKYRHYKGAYYVVENVARHSETEEWHAVYRPLYGEGKLWIRPLDMFTEQVSNAQGTVPRFDFVGSCIELSQRESLLQRLSLSPELLELEQLRAVLAAEYWYQPTSFDNGSVHNARGDNEGSCQVFAFARLEQLSVHQTLALFGRYYREDVLQNPDGLDHANIRQFIKTGPDAVHFDQLPLVLK